MSVGGRKDTTWPVLSEMLLVRSGHQGTYNSTSVGRVGGRARGRAGGRVDGRSGASKIEFLENIVVMHLDGHLTTPDGRPDGRMDGRTTDG